MNLVLSVLISAGLARPVILPGCCPVLTWAAYQVVPVVLVITRPAPPPTLAAEPGVRADGAALHVARI